MRDACIDDIEVDRPECRVRGRHRAKPDGGHRDGWREDCRAHGWGRPRRGGHWRGCQRCQLRRDVIVARIGVERALVPPARDGGIAGSFREVAQMAQGDQVFGVE